MPFDGSDWFPPPDQPRRRSLWEKVREFFEFVAMLLAAFALSGVLGGFFSHSFADEFGVPWWAGALTGMAVLVLFIAGLVWLEEGRAKIAAGKQSLIGRLFPGSK